MHSSRPIRSWFSGVAIPLILSAGQTSASQPSVTDRVIGLLALPSLFGRDVCDRFEPRPVAVFSSPSRKGTPIAMIKVSRNWNFPPEGGCDGLTVIVDRTVARSEKAIELPTMEFGYENRGAIVVERKERSFRIQLGAGTGWVEGGDPDDFYPLEALVRSRPSHLTAAWDGLLRSKPSTGVRPFRPLARRRKDEHGPVPVEVTSTRWQSGELWLRVRLLEDDPCSGGPPIHPAEGWLPAHRGNETTVWFSSRGC